MSASKAMESNKIMSDEENKGVFLYVFTQITYKVHMESTTICILHFLS